MNSYLSLPQPLINYIDYTGCIVPLNQGTQRKKYGYYSIIGLAFWRRILAVPLPLEVQLQHVMVCVIRLIN
jgi:hypothetical protein